MITLHASPAAKNSTFETMVQKQSRLPVFWKKINTHKGLKHTQKVKTFF